MQKEQNYWLHRITGGENASGLASNLLKKRIFIYWVV